MARKSLRISDLNTQFADNQNEILSLIQFSCRFAGLVECGVSLVRALLMLEDIPSPYGEAAHAIRLGVQDDHTLSHQMMLRPDLFSRFYIGMVLVGEMGGVLEMTLQRAAKVIVKECRLLGKIPGEPLMIGAPLGKNAPDDWHTMSEYQKKVSELLFCESFGALLSYGVPILQTLETLKSVIPMKQSEHIDLILVSIKNGEPIDIGRLGILSPFVVSLIQFGEEHDLLDRALLKAAEIIENELDAYWSLVAA